MEVREKLKELRNSKKISQREIAEEAGMSQAAYAKIEKGITEKISIEDGKGIAKALGVSFNELFDIEAPGRDENAKLKEKNAQLKTDLDTAMEMVNVQRLLLSELKERNEGMRLHLGVKDRMLVILFNKLTNRSTQKPLNITAAELQKEAFEELQIESPVIYGNKEYDPFTGAYETKKT